MKLGKTSNVLAKSLLITGLCFSVASAGKVLKIQTSFGAGDIALKQLNEWSGKLSTMTDGRLGIDLLPTRAVVPHKETPDAVAMGILDGDFTSISYFAGRDRAFALMGDLIAGYDTPDQFQTFCANGGGKEVLQKIWDKKLPGIHVLGCGPYSREAFVSTKPINDLAALKGVKLRAPEGLASEVFRRAGATPVAIPGSEIYTSLEKGVIDAADSSAYINNDARGMHKIAKYPLYPGIHSMPSMQFTITKSTWDKLPKADKAALETWFIAITNDLRRVTDLLDKDLVARDRAKGDLTIIDWAQKDRDAFRKIAVGAWEDFAKSSPLAQDAYDAHMKFMKASGIIK